MNMGSLNQPTCGANKSENEAKTRVSMSTKTGRKDHGPTLTLFKSDPANIKITQLLSKDTLTKASHKYTYVFGPGCSEIKSVSYQLGTLKTEVTREKCDNFESDFVEVEKIRLSVAKICDEFFEPTEPQTSDLPSVGSAAKPN